MQVLGEGPQGSQSLHFCSALSHLLSTVMGEGNPEYLVWVWCDCSRTAPAGRRFWRGAFKQIFGQSYNEDASRAGALGLPKFSLSETISLPIAPICRVVLQLPPGA